MKKFAFIILTISLLFGCSHVNNLCTCNNEPDPAAAYLFNGTPYDYTQNWEDAQIFGAVYSEDREGNHNSCLSFDGINDFVILPNPFDYSERSISLWFNVKEISSGYQKIYISDNPNLLYGSTNIDVHKSDSGAYILRMECGGAGGLDLETPIELGEWYHAVITINQSDVNAYINGKQYASAVYDNHASVDGYENVILGCNRKGNAEFFNGRIDAVKIYPFVLTEKQIKCLYKSDNVYIK